MIHAELLALKEAEDYFLSEKKLSFFINSAWRILEPTQKYLPNWHIALICEYLEAVRLGQIDRLLINIPFRHLKSIAVTVCFPVWWWINDPTKRFITASYADELSIKHNMDRRNLVRSDWFQRAWGDRFALSDDEDRKRKFSNDKTGMMFATSVGGSSTGMGADCIIIDDPINPKMARSDLVRESANQWRDQTVSTRKNNEKSPEIIVMQRLHEEDMSGHVLAKGGWTHLNIPWEAEQKTIIVFPVSKKTLTREVGHILHPERFSAEHKKQFLSDLGTSGFRSQLQQDPQPDKGGFFKSEWWRRYKEIPKDRLLRAMFVDCAEEPGITNDFTVAAIWDKCPRGYYAVEVDRRQVAFPGLEQMVKDLYYKFRPDVVVIENASAGRQLIQNLQSETTIPVIKFETKGRSKVIRASGAQPTIESGNAFLPEGPEWVSDFILEHEKFPNGKNDDQVDTTSMMVEYFRVGESEPGVTFL